MISSALNYRRKSCVQKQKEEPLEREKKKKLEIRGKRKYKENLRKYIKK